MRKNLSLTELYCDQFEPERYCHLNYEDRGLYTVAGTNIKWINQVKIEMALLSSFLLVVRIFKAALDRSKYIGRSVHSLNDVIFRSINSLF